MNGFGGPLEAGATEALPQAKVDQSGKWRVNIKATNSLNVEAMGLKAQQRPLIKAEYMAISLLKHEDCLAVDM